MHELVHGEQLDGGDSQRGEVLEDRRVREPGVGAAHLGRDVGVPHGQALDVGLVDDRLVPGDLQAPVVPPVEEGRGHHPLGDVGRAVAVVLPGDRLVPLHLALDGAGVGAQQQLVRVAAMAGFRRVGAVHAEAEALPGTMPGR